MLKTAMLLLPLVFIALGYVVYLAKFKIDKKLHDTIVSELKARGDFGAEEGDGPAC